MMSGFKLSIVFLFVSGSLLAQVNKFEIGVQAGPRLAWMYESSKTSTKVLFSSLQGLFGQYNLSEKFALRLELQHGIDGFSDKFIVTDNSGNTLSDVVFRYKFSYITIPMLVRASFGNNVKFFVNAGPSVGFLYDAKISGNNEVRPIDKSFLNSTNVSLVTGIGLLVPIQEKLILSFELRNSRGFQDIFKESDHFPNKTNSLDLLFGLSYKLRARDQKL